MPDVPFATSAALRVFLKQPNLDELSAANALADATGFIRASTKQWLSFVAGDVEFVEIRSATDMFVLSEYPVVNVSLIETFSDTTGLWTTFLPGRYRWLTNGIVRRIGTGYWPFGVGRLRVTYDHGYQVIDQTNPPGLFGVCVAMAARRTVNPQDRVAMHLGGFGETFNRQPGGPILATVAEQMIIATFRSPTAA